MNPDWCFLLDDQKTWQTHLYRGSSRVNLLSMEISSRWTWRIHTIILPWRLLRLCSGLMVIILGYCNSWESSRSGSQMTKRSLGVKCSLGVKSYWLLLKNMNYKLELLVHCQWGTLSDSNLQIALAWRLP